MTTLVFPQTKGQSFLIKKGPTWITTTKKSATGRQVRSSLQSAPVWNFKVAYEFIRDRTPTTSELQELWGFFNNVCGEYAPWYFQDPFDTAVSGVQIGVGNGATTSFQLARISGLGTSDAFLEPIMGVVGTPTVYINGTATTAFVLGSYGVITFTTAPANGAVITWTGNFYFLCHFTQADLSPAQMVKDLWSYSDGITFESLLP